MRLPLRTARFVLSPIGPDDADALVAYRREPEVARYQGWGADFSSEQGARLAAENPRGMPEPGEWLQLGIRDAATGPLLGDVAVHPLDDQPDTWELGVTLAPSSQGRGVATESLGAVRDALFADDGAHRVFAECDARNAAVQRLLERIGFRREARLVEADWFTDEWITVETWAQLRREWESG